MDGSDDVHDTPVVTSAVVPSLKVPTAVKTGTALSP